MVCQGAAVAEAVEDEWTIPTTHGAQTGPKMRAEGSHMRESVQPWRGY